MTSGGHREPDVGPGRGALGGGDQRHAALIAELHEGAAGAANVVGSLSPMSGR
jgi:hypothetical protein